MSGNKQGGVKLRETMIKKFGSEEAWKEWLSERGRKGGAKSVGGGFQHMAATDPKRHRELSKLGGKRGKRQAK